MHIMMFACTSFIIADTARLVSEGLSFAALVTLYWSYLEWLKYKTVKLLVYTVYRTRNRKQPRRK